jgi:CubicO group peptidase (beta-lactamase class C family)
VTARDITVEQVPAPESEGGWRRAAPEEAGLDPERLERARWWQESLWGGETWNVVVVRRGLLVAEWGTFNAQPTSRFDAWSCTKSFTSAGWSVSGLDLETPVYDLLPEGRPLTDPRKDRILVSHLLSMTSGIRGERFGVVGIPTADGQGPFEHALGLAPNRHGRRVDELGGEPGSVWDYSDPGFAHLSIAFAAATGRQLDDVVRERVLEPIGMEQASWDRHGGGGFLGPFTNAHTGLHLSARELARFGLLLLRGGEWGGARVLPREWVERASAPSQELNPSYGLGLWTNASGAYLPGLPRDLFAAMGYRGQRLYVLPSLDLVVARLGTGPAAWEESALIGRVVDSVEA